MPRAQDEAASKFQNFYPLNLLRDAHCARQGTGTIPLFPYEAVAAGAVLVGRPSDAAAVGVGTVEKEESAGNKTIRKGSETCR